MTRTYSFYDNGRVFIGDVVATRGTLRRIALSFMGHRTKYVDVLDEGVLVARISRK